MIKRVGTDNCFDCPLGKIREQEGTLVVKNWVVPDAEVCFHGLGPSKQEAENGTPFIDAAGKKLREAITKAGYDIDKVSFTNSVLCKPPNNKIDSTMTVPCLHHFKKESLKLMPNLKVVALCGCDSYAAVTGKKTTLKNVYLQPFNLEEYGELLFVPIPHPASILYRADAKNIAYFEDGVKGVFGLLDAQKRTTKEPKYALILTPEKLKVALGLIKEERVLSVDTETTSLKFYNANMICFALSWEDQTAVAIPWKWSKGDDLGYFWEQKEREEITETFRKVFSDKNKAVIAHNSKYDSLIFTQEFGFPISNIKVDTMLLSFHLDSNQPYGLDDVVLRECPEFAGYKQKFWEKVTAAEKDNGTWWKKYQLEEILHYCAEDASLTYSIAKPMLRRL